MCVRHTGGGADEGAVRVEDVGRAEAAQHLVW